MSRLHQFLQQINQLILSLAHGWQDHRVPLLARIFLLIAPIYLFCPYDLITDFLPRGYLDDLIIVPLLIFLGLYLVPRVVFIDARKVGARAACGLIFLSLTAQACQAAAPPSCAAAEFRKTGINEYSKFHRLGSITIGESNQAGRQPAPQANAPNRSYSAATQTASANAVQPEFELTRVRPALPDNVYHAFENVSQVFFSISKIVLSKIVLDFCRVQSAPIMLLVRGGQGQFYACASSFAAVCTSESSHVPKPPQSYASGFFSAQYSKLSPQAGI